MCTARHLIVIPRYTRPDSRQKAANEAYGCQARCQSGSDLVDWSRESSREKTPSTTRENAAQKHVMSEMYSMPQSPICDDAMSGCKFPRKIDPEAHSKSAHRAQLYSARRVSLRNGPLLLVSRGHYCTHHRATSCSGRSSLNEFGRGPRELPASRRLRSERGRSASMNTWNKDVLPVLCGCLEGTVRPDFYGFPYRVLSEGFIRERQRVVVACAAEVVRSNIGDRRNRTAPHPGRVC